MINNKQLDKHNTDLKFVTKLSHIIIKSFFISIFILLFMLIIFLICYFGDLLYNIKKGNNKAPLYSAYVIVSQSMVPNININDAVIVRRVDDSKLKVGDIITFSSRDSSSSGLTITHRIVNKQKISDGSYVYRTKGDNNNSEDSSIVEIEDIYGKVILKIPKLGYVQKFISTPFGFIISILVPISLVILIDIFRLFYAYRKYKENIEII